MNNNTYIVPSFIHCEGILEPQFKAQYEKVWVQPVVHIFTETLGEQAYKIVADKINTAMGQIKENILSYTPPFLISILPEFKKSCERKTPRGMYTGIGGTDEDTTKAVNIAKLLCILSNNYKKDNAKFCTDSLDPCIVQSKPTSMVEYDSFFEKHKISNLQILQSLLYLLEDPLIFFVIFDMIIMFNRNDIQYDAEYMRNIVIQLIYDAWILNVKNEELFYSILYNKYTLLMYNTDVFYNGDHFRAFIQSSKEKMRKPNTTLFISRTNNIVLTKDTETKIINMYYHIHAVLEYIDCSLDDNCKKKREQTAKQIHQEYLVNNYVRVSYENEINKNSRQDGGSFPCQQPKTYILYKGHKYVLHREGKRKQFIKLKGVKTYLSKLQKNEIKFITPSAH